jgi:U3 small nucleolar RNA-associated protein 10
MPAPRVCDPSGLDGISWIGAGHAQAWSGVLCGHPACGLAAAAPVGPSCLSPFSRPITPKRKSNNNHSGFRELCALDARFEPFARTLFSPPSAGAPGREGLDAAGTARLDASLAAFARLVGPHIASPAASRALEYLVRRYRIGEAVPAALIGAALPFHATHAFVRLGRVCALRGTAWEWLEPSLAAGAPLPRAALVARAAADPATLAAVAGLAEGGEAGGVPPAAGHLAFYAVTVCEALAAAAAGSPNRAGLSEACLRAVLPSVLAGLAPKAGPDRRAAALMVAAALAAQAALSVDLVQGERE